MNVISTATSAAADRIRIEDEVWDEAFASRVRSRPRRPVVVKARPAPSWFAEPDDTPGPFGVDRPSEPDPAFRGDPAGVPAPYGVDTPVPADAPPVRRTIHITGRGAERDLVLSGREAYAPARPRRRPLFDHRSGFEPDRLAMWAMLLGVALMAVAILSSSL